MDTKEVSKTTPLQESKKAEEDFLSGSFEDLQNEAQKCQGHKRRYVLAMDATSSMSACWAEAIAAMELVAKKIFARSTVPVEVKIIAYRDFCDGQEIISQCDWSSSKEWLVKFIHDIRCHGGGDTPEAISVGLETILKDENVSKIILIGDAPDHHEQGHDAIDPAKVLGQRHSPIYAFYTHENYGTKESFTRIAVASGGMAFPLKDLANMGDLITTLIAQDKVLGIECRPTSTEGKAFKDKLDREGR
jgi:hypothetical protein